MNELWIPIIFLLSIPLSIYFWLDYGLKRETERQTTIRSAMEKGQELTPELISSLVPSAVKSKYKDLRIGLPIVGLSIGFMLFGHFGVQDAQTTWAAALPFFFGLGFIIAWYISSKES